VKGLILFAGFVVASTAAAVLIGSFIERQTSPQVGTIVMLAMFFGGIVVSWIATVFVMDGSTESTGLPESARGRLAALTVQDH
jgi:FtsH-binding integral membrane protein